MLNGTKLWLLLGIVICIGLSGCGGSVSSIGFAQAPFITEDSIEFTAEELPQLAEIRAKYGPLFDKLQKHNNVRAAQVRAFNSWNLSQRVKQWQTLGYSQDDVKVMRKALIDKYRLKEPDKPEG